MSALSRFRYAAIAAAALSLAAAPRASAQSVELWAGAGSVRALSQPGPARDAGLALFGAAEVGRAGFPLRLRLESGFASQDLRTRAGGLMSGDVQTVHGALAGRVALFAPDAALAPYLVGGAALFRHSTRVELRSSDVTVPDGRFVSTTSEVVPGALVGAGLSWRLARVHGFAELRWTRSATEGEHTSTLPLTLGARLPVRN